MLVEIALLKASGPVETSLAALVASVNLVFSKLPFACAESIDFAGSQVRLVGSVCGSNLALTNRFAWAPSCRLCDIDEFIN